MIREPLLVVSPWFELCREQYQNELLNLSCDGDWDRWIAFFAEGVAASARASQVKVEELSALSAIATLVELEILVDTGSVDRHSARL